MIKKILSVILTMSVLLMMTPVWGTTAGSEDIMLIASKFSGGSGSSSSPYLISTAADLKQLATDVNGGESYSGKYFKMTANIDLNGSKSNKWTPIGIYGSGSFDVNMPFAGIFDGGGYKISNIYIYAGTSSDDALDSEGGGLFGNLSGTVKNLGVTSGTLRNESSYTWSYPCTGAIAGYSNGTIQNCFNGVNITGTRAGGIVGKMGDGKIDCCYNTGNVTGNTSSYDKLGGIVGEMKGGTISNCYNLGKIAPRSSTDWYDMGGIAGSCNGSTAAITKCYNYGTISGKTVTYTGAGGITGATYSYSTVTDCYYDTSKSNDGVGSPNDNVSNVVGLTTANFKTQSNFPKLDFSSTWVMSDWCGRPVLKNNSFTVTLYYNYPGNSNSEKHFVDYKTSFGTTNVPSRTGYTLSGWNTNADGSGASYSGAKPSVSFVGNSTLYAQWTADTYNITYKDQGNKTFTGTHGSGYPTKHTYNTTTTLVNPSKTGYDFGGWYTDSDCTGTKVTSLGPSQTSAITLYAKWTAQKYTITYKDQGNVTFTGTTSSPKTHTYDSVTNLVDATKKNHQFEGWYKDSDCTEGPVTSIGAKEITGDITLYAKWLKLSNTVTFDPNGGTLSGDTSKEYDPDAKYGTLPTPTRTGYEFGGWFKTPTCTDSAVQSDDTVEDSHTLYAKWDIITYAITYELDGGTNGNNPASYTVEQAVTLQNPTKTGYTFAGWYDNASFSGSSVAGIPKGTTGAKTFYAKWSINGYTVRYEKNGGTIENESSYTTYTYGSGFALPIPTKTGYTFGGWYTDSGFSGTEVTEISATDAENKTFYAKWTANEYTVTFDYKGADGGEITETERPVTYDSPYGTLPTPEKTGHTFVGWYTAASGGSAVTDSSTVNIADHHTLYAHWTADTYTVTYDKDGGTIANESNFTRYEYGVGLTLPTPTKTGYKFGGWYEDEAFGGSPVTEITDTDTDDKTYYAKWELITYTITYNLGGGTVTGNPDTYTVLSDSITLNAPSKVGHTFSGWSGTDITGTSMSVTIAAGSTGDREYTANWSANQYTVTFEYEDEDGNVITESRDETYGESYDLPNAPKRKGFTFGGWFTEENGQGDKITDDTKVDITTAQTLYASWIECQHEDMVWTDDQDGEHHSGTCDNCGKFVTEEHSWDDGEITLEPTTETEGEKLFSCTDCEATYTEVIPKHEHDFSGEWEGHDENGHWHVCPVDKATDAPVDHVWDDGEVTKEATETEEGEMTYTCGDCGATKTEKTDKLPPTSDDTPPTTGGDNSDSSSQPSTGTTPSPSTGNNDTPSTGDTSDPSEDASEPSTGDSTDPSDGNNAGNVTVNSESGENAPDVSISEETSTKLKEEVIAEHLTPEEMAAVANGDDLEVILVVEDAGDTVPVEDKQVTENVLTDTEYTVGMYLNVDLIKLINGQQVGKITKISSPIHVTIEIPEELRSANRAFAIVRVHNGVAEILEDVDDDPDTITIVTDKFSTYSIAYQDTDANPHTGVATPIAITGLACAVIVAAVTVKRKKIIE